MMSCRQLYFGQLDMELHANYDPKSVEKGGESIWDVQKRMASKYIPHSMPLPEDRFLCSFQHIFAGGYSAGYYSYKWAEVMSADAFAAFEEVGLDNEDKVKEVGLSFRDTVLGLGGGKLHQFALPDDELATLTQYWKQVFRLWMSSRSFEEGSPVQKLCCVTTG